MQKKIYLAGPDIFFPDAKQREIRAKHAALIFGLDVLYPLDNEITLTGTPEQNMVSIFCGNVAMIDRADCVVANLCDFRGSEPDSGTVWEVAYAYAKGIPVIGYKDSALTMAQRLGSDSSQSRLRDADGIAVENFGAQQNLMVQCSLEKLVIGGVEKAIEEAAITLGIHERYTARVCPEEPMSFTLESLTEFGLGSQIEFIVNGGNCPDQSSITEKLAQLRDYLTICTKTPYYNLGNDQDGIYMGREWLIEKTTHSPAARIHNIYRSDSDRASHDHPWRNMSVLLQGRYFELVPAKDGHEDLSALPEHLRSQVTNIEPMVAIERKAGDVVCRQASDRHKLMVEPGKPAMSLFVSSRKIKDWGFYTAEGFVVHTKYLETEDQA